MSFEAKVKEMGLTVPEVAKPVAAYVPSIRVGDYVYTSGQIPFVEGKLAYAGKIGKDLSLEQGYEAAKVCALNCLAAAKSVIGSLDNIEQIVKVVGFVNSAPGFVDQPKVINGASELIGTIFGKQGEHTRSAVGVPELPINAAVEVEMIFKVKS
ncbi:MAG: endoribonuclease family protein [Firmicutes bacterium]|nr:endoribonuclease family protein [Bacillota bacterium]